MSEEIKDATLEQEPEVAAENTQTEQPEVADEAPAKEEVAEQADTVSPEEKLQAQLAELQDKHLRLTAEYDNYRKRTLKEKSELIRSGGEKSLSDLLPVIDDLDIALQNLDKATDLDALKEGMHLIYSKFADYLNRQGVKPIETEGQPFDEELHEAIATFPAPEEGLKGKIIDCVKKGYKLNDKVLRHASVVVGQ